MFGYSWKFIIGLLLLLTNQPLAWAGVALCAYVAKKSGKKSYYGYGTVIYVVSWGMVVIGIVLAGREGAMLAKQLIRTYWWQLLGGVIVVVGVMFYVRGKKKKTVPVIAPRQAE